MTAETEANQIKSLLAQQAQAISNRDISGASDNYSPDVIIFDVVGPLAHPAGSDSVRERLSQWFSGFAQDTDIEFRVIKLHVSADNHLAFSHAFNHVHATLTNGNALDMYWRETLNWRRIDGNWKIVHAHSSVPFDPATGKASTGLQP